MKKTSLFLQSTNVEWVINKLDEANTHIRYCICNESQTAPHNFDEGKVTEEATHTSKGTKTFTCTDGCGYSYTEEIPTTTDHEWTDWSPNGDGTHTRACRCNANETKDCEWGDGVVTTEPTHTSKGVKTFTCTVCGHTYTEDVPETTEHQWTDWSDNKDGTHTRSCRCNANETEDCTYGDGVPSIGTTEGSFAMVYTCTVCQGTKQESARGATVRFENCEGLNANPLTFIQNGDQETYTVVLPGANDIAAREGSILIGWVASIDGVTYSAGSELFIKYSDGASITFTAEWATILGEGEQKLEQDTPYYVEGESFELEGEGIEYRGEQVFYVPKSGLYTLINVTEQKEVPQQ